MKTRFAGSLGLLVALTLLQAVGAAAAPVPPGPRLTVLRLAFAESRVQVVTTGGEPTAGDTAPPLISIFGASASRTGRGPVPSGTSAPVWSPDGARIVFAAANRAPHPEATALFSVSAAGGTPRRIPGTSGGFDPVFSPDGKTLAFARSRKRSAPNSHGGERTVYESSTTWTTNLATGGTRRLTDWQNGLSIVPSSYSPDGSTLAATKSIGPPLDAHQDAIVLPSKGGAARVILPDAIGPNYSPDGTRIAFLRGPVRSRESGHGSTTARLTDIYTAASDGSDVRRVTSTPNALEAEPSWDPSGQRLAFTRVHPFEGEASFSAGDEIAEINADGTCPEILITDPKALLIGNAWQPGPGREAGPIVC